MRAELVVQASRPCEENKDPEQARCLFHRAGKAALYNGPERTPGARKVAGRRGKSLSRRQIKISKIIPIPFFAATFARANGPQAIVAQRCQVTGIANSGPPCAPDVPHAMSYHA